MKKKGNVCPLHNERSRVAKLGFVPSVPKICTTFCHPLTIFATNRNTHVLETQIFALVSVATSVMVPPKVLLKQKLAYKSKRANCFCLAKAKSTICTSGVEYPLVGFAKAKVSPKGGLERGLGSKELHPTRLRSLRAPLGAFGDRFARHRAKALWQNQDVSQPPNGMQSFTSVVEFVCEKKSVLDVVQQVKDVICKKQLIECSMGVILSISGGQDSIFLLLCLSFLQSKITFTFKMLWCNHFWQSDSFYTTLHLTMCAVNFRKTIITFLPLFVFDSDLLVFFNTHSSLIWVKQIGESATNNKLARRWVHRRMKIIDHRVENNKDNAGISKSLPKGSTKATTLDYARSETLARHWRHLTTERSCTFYTLEEAIYGHTLSDRVETIMFNLVRGAGNTGLQSLLWKRKFSTFFYNWFFLSYQHVLYKTHFSTALIQYHPRRVQ